MASESEPLLSPASSEREQDEPEHISLSSALFAHLHKWRTLYLCGLLTFIIDFAEFMRVASSIQMLELNVCRDHYRHFDPSVIGPDGDIASKLCKVDAVQTRLANMRGILALIGVIPGKL